MANNGRKLEDLSYEEYNKHLQDDTHRLKMGFAEQIRREGDSLIDEIKQYNDKRLNKKEELIPYILKHSTEYTYKELREYSLRDVVEIHEQLKKDNVPFIVKIFKFIFNH